jgi:hypothetical protein
MNQITKAAFFHLRNITCLRPSLSLSAAETLVHALISSRLDYCNSILYGSSKHLLNKLQYVQNSAARILTSTHRSDHTPVLQDLHWLPVKYRIDFKILLFTLKALNNLAPPSLSDLLHRHTPTRCLRSADANLLHPVRTDLRSWGDRAFVAAAPALWKALPNDIRNANTLSSFKTALKGCISDSDRNIKYHIHLLLPHDPLAARPISRLSKNRVSLGSLDSEIAHRNKWYYQHLKIKINSVPTNHRQGVGVVVFRARAREVVATNSCCIDQLS